MQTCIRYPLLLLTAAWCLTAGLASARATQWTEVYAHPGSSEILWDIADGAGGLIAVGTGGRIVGSVDGQTWTPRDSGVTDWLVAVANGFGRYVAVGDHGRILTSTDGVTWSVVPNVPTTMRLNNVRLMTIVATNKPIFVAVGEGGTILESVDGLNWQAKASPTTHWLRGLANSVVFGWVATGEKGTVVARNVEDTEWKLIPVNTTLDLESVILVNEASDFSKSTPLPIEQEFGFFLAVGEGGQLHQIDFFRTNDFSKPLPPPFSLTHKILPDIALNGTRLRSIARAGAFGRFFLTGENGTVVSAPGYGGWQAENIGNNRNIINGLFVQNHFYAVGSEESVIRTDEFPTTRLLNLSTRGLVGSGDKTLIAGLTVQGDGPKRVLIRAVGPGLKRLGVNAPLPDPALRVVSGSGVVMGTNDGWGNSASPADIVQASGQVGAFPLVAGEHDSALVLTLPPGSYTCLITSTSGQEGIALVESYDLAPLANLSTRSTNLSTRGQVGTGENVLIAGLVVEGPAARNYLIRGIGPGLKQFGVGGTLDNPQIELRGASGNLVIGNDQWQQPPLDSYRAPFTRPEEVQAVMNAVGAFSLADNSADAAMVVSLDPGVYTVVLSGVGSSTGVGLIEVYEIPF